MTDDRFTENQNQRPYVKYRPLKFKSELKLVSRVPGTPPAWESLFICISSGQTENAAFSWLRRLFKQFSDEQIWEFHEHWSNGKVHPKIQK